MADSEVASIREVLEEAIETTGEPVSTLPPAEPPTSTSTAVPSTPPIPTGDGQEEKAIDPALRDKIEGQLAKLSPEEKANVLKDLRNYDRGFHKSMAKVADFRKFAEGLVSQFPGVTAEELTEALGKHRRPAPSPLPASSVDEEDIDALIEKAPDPSVREELRKSKAVLHREMDKRLTEKLKPLQEELERLKQTATVNRVTNVEADIDTLEEVEGLPASFVEKYRASIKSNVLKYNIPVKEALRIAVPFDELREAFAAHTPPTGPLKKPSVAGPTATVSTPVVSNGSLDKFKERSGGWNIKGALRSMLPKG